MKERDLKGLFERLAGRGEPRGAGKVLEAAQTRATVPPVTVIRRFAPAIAVAAAISLIGAVTAIAAIRKNDAPQIATRPLGTMPSSTTEPPVAEVSIPAKLIAQSRLIPFSNCGTFTTYLRTEGLKYVSAYGLPGQGGNTYMATGGVAAATGAPEAQNGAAAQDSSAPPPSGKSLAATGEGYSDTNVQEAGIDEPDMVKTDGKRIYALRGDTLYVVDAVQPRILGSLKVGYTQQMFLVGKRVVTFSGGPMAMAMEDRAIAPGEPYPGPGSYRQQVRVTTIDVSTPESMKEVSHLDVDGAYVDARLVNGVARVVISSTSSRMGFVYPSSNSPEAQQTALETNRNIVRKSTWEDWAPRYTITGADGKTSAEKAAVACGDAYRPPEFAGFGMLSVLSLDPARPDTAKTTSVMADGQTVYGSAERLYVATQQWGNVRPVEAGAPTVMPPQSPKTLIHAFDISDPGLARYTVSGTVRGTILNQFSFSEYKGNLRVATTEGDQSQSFVTVLADNGKILDQIGQVGGLGKGERIYAVRFIGALGYVVTFRQVDPLYVVDLSNATAPKVVGELKITGYSAYLHPISDTLLIGIGQEASEQGRRLGTQVSLFDVSNPAAPKLLQRHVMGQGGSQAEFDHHAFLYWAPKQLTVVPIQEYDPNKGTQGFNGAVGLHTVPSEIREVGRITHAGGQVVRTIVIGSHLFTYSDAGIKANDIDSFAEQAYVAFPNPPQTQPYDGGGGTAPPSEPQTKPAAA